MSTAIVTIGVTIVVGLFFLFIIVRLIFSTSGRAGGTDSSGFPYDNSWNSIPPPSWSPDSGSASDNAACDVSDSGGWGDSGSDSGSCDSGGDSGGGGGGD